MKWSITLPTSYAEDMDLFRTGWHKFGLIVGLIFCVVFPLLAGPRWLEISTGTCVAVVGALGLMILTGFAGQISLGHAGFLALGAYTTAVLGAKYGIPFWICLPAGGVVATVVGLAVGPFALRLRGLYLAIVTLGLLFLVQHAALTLPDLTGGSAGLSAPAYWWFPDEIQRFATGDFGADIDLGFMVLAREHQLYLMFLIIAVICTLATKNLRRSRTGRAMLAVRDQDLAAEALGISPARVKVTAFGISSFLAGLAGGMFALQQQFITAPTFGLAMSVDYIAMCVLGGTGTVFGGVAGAIAFECLSPLAEVIGPFIPGLDTLSNAEQSTLLFSVTVIGFMLFEPLGLFGIWLRIQRYFLAWPFKY